MKISSKLYCKNLWAFIVALIFIISTMVPMVARAEINSTGTYFWISPTTNIHQAYGSYFNITINIASAPPTYAWDLDLAFNNNTLSVVGAWNTTPSWLGSSANPVVYTSFATANKQGWIGIGETIEGSSSGVSGNGTLCIVEFKVLASGVKNSGTSVLNLVDGTTALLSPSLVSTVYPNNDGFFAATTVSVHDIGITSVVSNVSSPVSQGTPVKFTVTVNNQGNYTESVSVTVTAVPTDTREPTVTIGTNTTSGLTSGSSKTLTFPWSTTTVNGQVYNIVSNATITTSGVTDIDLHNNVFIGPVFRVISPNDIKVAGVTILTPTVHKGKTASINVTMYNEGQNLESFNAYVWAINSTGYATNVASVAFSLGAGVTSSSIASWTTTGVTPDYYTIKANATVAGDTDLADNQMTATGTIHVIIQHVSVIKISMGSGYVGKSINVTVKNFGTVATSFTVYAWAVWPNQTSMFNATWSLPTVKPPTPNALLVGEIAGVYLDAGANYTTTTLDPYGQIYTGPTGLPLATGQLPEAVYWPTLWAPYTPLAAHQSYKLYFVAVILYDYDDNPSQTWLNTTSTAKAPLPGDVNCDGTVNWIDLGILGLAYNSSPITANWNPRCDINFDKAVNWVDLGDLGLYYNLSS